MRWPTSASQTRSSATNLAPRDISSSASEDLPLPDGPMINSPRSPTATQEAWIGWSMASDDCEDPVTGSDRHTDDEPRAERLGGNICVCRANIFGPDNAAMRFDDLLGNGKSKTRVVAELTLGAL